MSSKFFHNCTKLSIMKKAFGLIALFLIGMGWIYGFVSYLNYTSPFSQGLFVLLIFAPLVEEIIFREFPYQIGKRWNCLLVMQLASAIVFGYVHMNHYPYFGSHYAFFVQGFIGLILFKVREEFNLFWCMVYHFGWNLTCLFIFN